MDWQRWELYYNVKIHFNVSILYTIAVPKCFEFISLKIECGFNKSIVVVGIFRFPSADSAPLLNQRAFSLKKVA